MSVKMVIVLLFAGLLYGVGVASAVNITMHGKLVAEPCSLKPGDEKKEVFVGDIGPAFLYDNVRTAGTDFVLRLENCDVTTVKNVTITYSGAEDCELPGHLAIESKCTTRGVAIGIETPQGKFLPLFQESASYPLIKGANELQFRAFVRASDKAIANRAIVAGTINATATFVLNYS